MSVSLQRALLVLVLVVLAIGLVPAGVVLDRQLRASLEESVREDLSTAPLVLRDQFQNQAGARMMHAREISGDGHLTRAILDGDTATAVAAATELAAAFPGEQPLVVDQAGRSWVGPSLPRELVEVTRGGAMPVEVVKSADAVGTVALAPVKVGDEWMGAAGVWVPMATEEAATLAALTRSDVLITAPDDALGAYTGRAEPAMGLFGLLSQIPQNEEVHELEWGGVQYLVLSASIPGGARVTFVRSLDEALAVVPALRRMHLTVFALALVLAFAVGTLFAVRLAQPVRALAVAAERVGEGDFDSPVQHSAIAEVEQVARSFELMRDALRARIAELSEANDALEERQARLAMLQAELVQRDRLSSSARLLAQLAHEVRNPVASVRNCLEILRRRVTDDAEASRFADLAIDELLRMHELTEQMLDLHRPREEEGECNAAAVAGEVAEVVRLGMGERDVTVNVEADSPVQVSISADPLKQILLNLMQNAQDAIAGSGSVTIRVGAEGERGAVVIQDTGPGIAEDALDHVFDPFFTTKADVHGVGLGLFTADGLARTFGGRLVARNRDGGGAEMIVDLPLAAAESAGEARS